jgi:hypothetical protein
MLLSNIKLKYSFSAKEIFSYVFFDESNVTNLANPFFCSY